MSLDTLQGLRKREEIRRQVQAELGGQPERFHAINIPDKVDPDPQRRKSYDSLKELTMFTADSGPVSRIQGRPIHYFKRPIMPHVDLERERKYKERAQDTLRNLNYFSFEQSESNFTVSPTKIEPAKTEKSSGKAGFSKSTKLLKFDRKQSRRRFRDNAINMIPTSGRGEAGRGYGTRSNRDRMLAKIGQEFVKQRDREGGAGGGLLSKVDFVYENLLKGSNKF